MIVNISKLDSRCDTNDFKVGMSNTKHNKMEKTVQSPADTQIRKTSLIVLNQKQKCYIIKMLEEKKITITKARTIRMHLNTKGHLRVAKGRL